MFILATFLTLKMTHIWISNIGLKEIFIVWWEFVPVVHLPLFSFVSIFDPEYVGVQVVYPSIIHFLSLLLLHSGLRNVWSLS